MRDKKERKEEIRLRDLSEEERAEFKHKRRKRRIIAWSVTAVAIFVLVFNFVIMPATSAYHRTDDFLVYDGDNGYICFDNRAMISAHRAGGDLAPEETLMAFELCMTATDYVVDIVEFDLHITADDKLVLLHDDTVDRTSNAVEFFGEKKIKVRDKTLAELKQLNFGENFQALNGEYPYRGLRGEEIPDNIKILALDEVLDYLTGVRPNLHYLIEIKDGGKDGKRATDILIETMEKYGITDNTVLGTFHNGITNYFDKAYPNVKRSAGIADVLDFYFAFLYGINNKKFEFDVLGIPVGGNLLYNLATEALIDYAHSHDIAVQYWTINDADEISRLVAAGADAIITDNPEVAYSVIYGNE